MKNILLTLFLLVWLPAAYGNHNLEEQAKTLYCRLQSGLSQAWQIGKAEDFFEITIGKTPPRKEPHWFSKNAKDIIWVSIADMGQAGPFISNSSEFLTKDAVQRFNVKRVQENTVLLSFKLTVGRVAISDCELTTNEAIAHFSTTNPVLTEYTYFYLKNFNYQTLGSTSSIATAINSKTVKKMPFELPPYDELKKFHKDVAPLFQAIRHNLHEMAKLRMIRDTLLPKLMFGEIDVSEVKI